MLYDRLAASERAGYSRNAALCYREKRIYDALTRYHGSLGRELFTIGSASPYGPPLKHRKFELRAVCTLYASYGLVYVSLTFVYPDELALCLRREHNLVKHGFCLADSTEHVACSQLITHFSRRNEVPKLFVVE